MSPMVLTGSTFGGDWPTHLWLVQMQANNISALGHPSLFFQSGLGGFEPWYAFYGGTLYSIVGAASVLSGGHTLAVYILSFAVVMAMAFGGFAWIGRQVGLGSWASLIAAAVFLTSTYYVTDVYARGAWAEAVATSAIPLVVASALWLLRAPRWRPAPLLAFLLATVIFSGSHNITLLYGAAFLGLLSVTVTLAVGPRALPGVRRIVAVLSVGGVAIAINLWFLLPDVMYGQRTLTGHSFTKIPEVTGGMPPGLIFDPVRHSNIPGFATFDLQVPTLALIWAVVALAVCWRGLAPVWRRLAVAVFVTGIPFLALLMFPHLWYHVPRVFWAIQFPFRLLSYVDYSVVGLVLIAVVALVRRSRGALTTGLVILGVLFAGIELSQAIVQEWNGPSSLASRSESFPGGSKVPSFWTRFVSYHQYQDYSLPQINAEIGEIPGVTGYNGEGENVISVSATGPIKSSYTIALTPPKTGTINTNVIAGPYLVGVRGAKFVGRSPNQNMVMRVKREPDGRPTKVTFTTAGTWP
ncbi:MAG TPA: hypothetical protein VHT29_01575, partial [Solirubrobacteraceae bacterium]|nr:hypothetical protein [Solirubrobacteraceae bacterium]